MARSHTDSDSGINNKLLFIALIIIVILSLIASVGLTIHHIHYRSDLIKKTKTDLWSMTVEAVEEIEATLTDTMRAADDFADELTAARPTDEDMLRRLRELVKSRQRFHGAAVSFRPYGHDPVRRLHAPYYKKSFQDETLKLVMVEDVYDYTEPEHEWYVLPMAQGSCWTQPYWGKAGQTFMLSYSSVFYESDAAGQTGPPLGVVTIDISMDGIKKLINSLDLGPGGFGALVSRKGVYIHHPNREYIISQKNLFATAKKKKDNNLLLIAQKAAKGESAILELTDEATGQESWLAITPIPATGWSLQNTFFKDDVQLNIKVLRRQLMCIVLAYLLFLSASLALFFRLHRRSAQRIRAASLTCSILTALATGLIWIIALSFHSAEKSDGVRLFNDTTLHKFMNRRMIRAKQQHVKPPIFVPTGIYVESMKFFSADDIRLTGYIRQKFDSSFPADAEKKLRISKATNVSIKEVRRRIRDRAEFITYRFEADIRKNFSHEKYPLERECIQVRIVADESKHNIVLTPDLDAHSLRGSRLLPGIAEDAFLPGWKLTAAFYELSHNDPRTTFGHNHAEASGARAELCYNILVRRNIADAFISNLTPLFFVSIMLFFLLLLSTRLEAGKIFNICMAVFFVIVFSHIDIRRKICAARIFYFECFYFVTYGAILYVTLNTVSVLLRTNQPLLRYKKNLIAATLYWPIIQGSILLVTISYFY